MFAARAASHGRFAARARWRVCAACFCLLAAAIACTSAGDDGSTRPVAVVFQTDDHAAEFGAVHAKPLPRSVLATLERRGPSLEEWQSMFGVYVGDSTALPMLGTYAVGDSGVTFTPRYPPTPGTTYVARFDGLRLRTLTGLTVSAGMAEGTWTYTSVPGAPTTTVAAVYPSPDTLPANLLRLYIHFSAPMSLGESARRVQLRDADGRAVPDAFLVPAGGEELWDRERRQLTLLFDPGRIKRDLRPNMELGVPLIEGRTYDLVIDSAWTDANRRTLVRPFVKRFTVGPADRTLPRAGTWTVTAPPAGSRDAVVVDFAESLDRALLQRLLSVRNAAGAYVDGVAEVSHAERRWSFTPDAAWTSGAFTVDVDTGLEDLAGNTLQRLFDVKPGDPDSRGVADAVVRLPFSTAAR